MPVLPESVQDYIGLQSEEEVACDPVERGAVRRYAQAIMDEDLIYQESIAANRRYGGPVAPPLFPTHMFRRPFGQPDPLQENARNPDFDGIVAATSTLGLPEIVELRGFAVLHGGMEIEFFRYARHGETVTMRCKYVDISEKETSKGPIVLVVIENEYRTSEGELLIRARRTQIRRK